MCNNANSGMAAGTLTITILPDGRIRIDTGSFAGAQHASAEAAIPAIAAALGVTIEDVRARVVHAHNHEHTHNHNHEHEKAGSK